MKKLLLASAAVALFASSNASAASLISASITGGTTGLIWNTTSDTNNAVFVSRGAATLLNPNDEALNFNAPASSSRYSFAIFGDGYTAGSANSDALYTLRLAFSDGAVITGQYVGSTLANATTATVGGLTYTLTGFGWDRSNADNVSRFTATTPGDNPADYTGQFSFSVAAVPEPTTWAMMLVGFAMVGGTARYRRRHSQVVYS